MLIDLQPSPSRVWRAVGHRCPPLEQVETLNAQPKAAASPAPRKFRRASRLLLTGLVGLTGAFALYEIRTSWLQSRVFSAIASRLHFSVEPGPNPDFRHPHSGPYDIRLGYSRLDRFLPHLSAAGFRVDAQARASRWFNLALDLGLHPIYREKPAAGLRLLDRDGNDLFAYRFPERIYPSFEAIPPLVVNTLLFIENRELLDPQHRYRNPAVEWDRLANATFSLGLRQLGASNEGGGGSTLATQLEKLRHSPGGVTRSVGQKVNQMVSASIRAYQNGPETAVTRREVVRDYLNSIPLSAAPGYGEVFGLGDGLEAWFGTSFNEVNRLLAHPRAIADEPSRFEQTALAYRQVLSLLVAIKKPSEFLLSDRSALTARTDLYLNLLAGQGIIPAQLRDQALATRLTFRERVVAGNAVPFSQRKGSNSVRVELLGLLGLDSLYELDRLDLTVATALDGKAQREATGILENLGNPEFAAKAGLLQPRLLAQGDPSRVTYSLALYERAPEGNVLRVQADNYDQPLDINAGTKLELGSTAKLRTLVGYLEAVAELHGSLSRLSPDELRGLEIAREDGLTLWARDLLLAAPNLTLADMLEEAMNRRYSASPAETFFTGGGAHTFSNFDSEDNGRILTVRQAFQRSVNLVFIRLMRDLVRYHMFRLPGVSPLLLEDPHHPAREGYLKRFADREGRQFLTGFYQKYEGLKPDEALQQLAQGIRRSPRRLAVVYRSVRPDAGVDAFAAFLIANTLNPSLPEKLLSDLYEAHGPGKFNLQDRAYLAGIHPLELWLLEYKTRHRDAGLSEVIRASEGVRQESYRWLFSPRKKRAQDRAIRVMLEGDTFEVVHRTWKRLGYPFGRLVPSYATSLGTSGDTPAALAELIGILLNDGVRLPGVRVRRLDFAQRTPFETILSPQPRAGETVLNPAIARLVRKELIGVVEAGTAVRARGAVVLRGGEVVQVGGKTGTGDNRHGVFARSGRTIESKVLNRTATFVFLVGDRFFGVITAFVPGEAAAGYAFTSSLPVQVFKILAPTLVSLVERQTDPAPAPRA